MSDERLDTRVDPSRPDDDESDWFTAWEEDDADLTDEQEGEVRDLIVKALGRAEGKLAPHPHAPWDPLKHPRVPGGRGDTSGEFVSARSVTGREQVSAAAVARAITSHAVLDKDPLDIKGPTGTDAAAYDRDTARVLRRSDRYLNAGLDTETLYDRVEGVPGKYRAEREAVHQQVIDHFVNAPGVKSERKMLIMGGLPGAGKTTYLRSEEGRRSIGNVDLNDYVIVNSDDVKEYMAEQGLIPNWPGLTEGEAVGLYHEEAALISKAVLEKAAAQGKNIAYDVTLHSPEQMRKATGVLDRNGDQYERTLVFIDVPVDLAIDRAKYRYQRDTGRYVPIRNIEKLRDETGVFHSKNRHAFESVKAEMDRWFLVDNTSGPRLVARKVPVPE